jgi:hypothetical protein
MIVHLAQTQFNLPVLRKVASEVCGKDLSTEVKAFVEPIVALQMLLGYCDEDDVREAKRALEHFTATFLSVHSTDNIPELLSVLGGKATVIETRKNTLRVVIITQSWKRWIDMIKEETNDNQTEDTLLVLNELHKFCEDVGLRRFFEGYSKEKCSWPNLYILRKK